MKLALYIARRYLFAPQKRQAIHLIAYISLCGIAVATMAMVCTLSVFNGFERMVVSSFSAFDPDLKIEATKGKVLRSNIPTLQQISSLPQVKNTVYVLEEDALLKYGNKQMPVRVKGVSDNFTQAHHLQSLVIDGNFELYQGDIPHCVMGAALAVRLQAYPSFVTPIQLFAPQRQGRVNLAIPQSAFVEKTVYLSGVLSLNNIAIDETLLVVSLDVAQALFQYAKEEVSFIEIQLKEGVNTQQAKREIETLLGEDYVVKDRYQQQASTFRMLKIEKWVTFFILIFIALIAIFNIIGAHTMLIIDKQEDIATLKSMGASNRQVAQVFLCEGWMICIVGVFFGVTVGVLLSLVQQLFGIIKISGTDAFGMQMAYPVEVHLSDVLLTTLVVLLVGLIATTFPVRSLMRELKR